MSETQQTTAERLAEIISERLDLGSGEWISAVEAAQEIAAEIDALTRELAEVKEIVAAGRYQRNLDVMTIAAQADVIDERNAQLAEARAEVAVEADELELKRIAWEGQRAAYEAEVERLAVSPSEALIEQVCLALSIEVGPDGILNRSRAAETVAGWLAVRYRNIAEQADTIAALKAEVARLTPADVGDGPIPDEDVLAWDGISWHVAHHAYSRQTENDFLIDADDLEDVDNNGVAWLKEGWYEIQESHDSDYDFLWSPIKRPITHWMRLPAAARAREAAKEGK